MEREIKVNRLPNATIWPMHREKNRKSGAFWCILVLRGATF